MRLESTIKNSVAGMLYLFTYTLLGFASRTVFVYILGMEYNGLNALYSSVLSIFSLAELGIGVAVSYCLYKPLADGDEQNVAALMNFFRGFYRIVAALVTVAALAILPFLQSFVITELPIDYVRAVFLLFALENALTYLCTYKVTLLIADQKNYISTLYETVINAVVLIARLGVLLLTHSYVAYVLIGIAARVLGNVLRSRHIDKMYPYLRKNSSLRLNGKQKAVVYKQAGNVAVYKVCDVAVTATDNILLSVLCGGVVTVGLYSNYNMIVNVVNGLAGQFVNSYQASLGNLYAEEGKERIYDIYKKTSFLSVWIAAWFGSCLLGLLQPFIRIWMGERALLSNAAVLLLSLAFCLRIMEDPLAKLVNAAGLFAKDKYFTLCNALVNLFFSVILGIRFGVAGVFAGTAIGFCAATFLRGRYIFSELFQLGFGAYLVELTKHLLLLALDAAFTLPAVYGISLWLGDGIAAFALKLLCCLMLPNLLNCLLLHKLAEFKFYWQILRNICRRSSGRRDEKGA